MSLVCNIAYRKKKKVEPVADIDYLVFSSDNDFSVTLGSAGSKTWDGTLEVSTDGTLWSSVVDGGETYIGNANQRVYYRGINNTHITTYSASGNYGGFILLGTSISCNGNIETLLDYATVQNGSHPTMANDCYIGLFKDNANLISAPSLPAIAMVRSAYEEMFRGCTTLATAPDLPATTLAVQCYRNMFAYCSSLTNVMATLPATVSADGCYIGLFYHCTMLRSAPVIALTSASRASCADMFAGCTSLKVAPALKATTLGPQCYYGMFRDCTALETIPALQATTLVSSCYEEMFSGATKVGLYTTASDDHNIAYAIPYTGSIVASPSNAKTDMFTGTGGTVSAPSNNTTYYVYSVIEPDGTILTSEPTHIYGASWDGTSTTKWTRTDEAADFADPVPYVLGATEYGSPFDDLYPWKDMTIVEDDDTGTMVKIPKFWYKLTQNGTGMSIQIADKAVEGYSVCPACMDHGDGNGERDYILIGRYHCASSTYKSKTDELPAANATRADFRTGIQALGTGIYMSDWATRFTLFLLYLVEFADWNSQNVIGCGCGNGSSTGNMGYTDSMPYHTGTTRSSRTTYGLGTQYRNIEGLWDNVYDWIDGCYNSSAGLSIILDPTKFSDDANGISVGVPTSGIPMSFNIKTIAEIFPLFMPSVSGGTMNGYSCDGWYFYTSHPCICVGGYCNQSAYSGLFSFNYGDISGTYDSIGSRPMKLPNFTNN